jgi:hypothetical protein
VDNQIRKTDVRDEEFLDAEELQSDSTFVYLTTSVISTTSGTKVLLFDMPADGEGILYGRDHPAEHGDFVVITGTSGGLGDGTYTIDAVLSDTSLSVVEPISTSTGGSVAFHYKAGASRIGFDSSNSAHITADNVQDAIEELDASISGELSPDIHKTLRQLVHLADGAGGPFEGFLTGAYKVVTGTISPSSVIWYEDNTQTQKIVEKTITWAGPYPTSISWIVYNSDGATLLAQATDIIVYSGPFEIHRTRSLVDYGIAASDLTAETHKAVRQLIHLSDGVGGPWEGFPTGAYREITYSGFLVTKVAWYDDSTKAKKIVEKSLTYNSNFTVSAIAWVVYDTDGTTALGQVSDAITYSSFFEVARTRSVV